MKILSHYGWAWAQQQYYESLKTELQPGRVMSIKGFKHFLITEQGELEAELSGKLLFETENSQLPKAGDWVLYVPYDTAGYIVEVFPRTNAVTRKSPGKKTELQVLAANIDYAFVVQGLDQNFNLMRLERYIVQLMQCKVKPIVLLNKVDLVAELAYFDEQVKRLGRDVDVYFCSTYTGAGFSQLESLLTAGKTFVLIGSSGVGKSSILNRLLDVSRQDTAEVSSSNLKGRHTTTVRETFLLPGGALLIDTPGMREFGLTGDVSESQAEHFPAVEELSQRCRYADCTHMNESGCAVLSALDDGSLDPLIYHSYVKLVKEQRRFQISAEDKKQRAKQFGRLTKEAKKHRKKYKY